MADVLVATQITTKGNRVERIKEASRCRLTNATLESLKINIKESGSKVFGRYNHLYNELKNAVISAEVAAAENQVRASITQSDAKANAQEEANRLSLVKEDEEVAKIVNVPVVKQRIMNLSVDLFNLGGRFGTIGNNFGVPVKSKYLPKALSVPKIKTKTYREISRKVSLYKLAGKVGFIKQELSEETSQAVQVDNNGPKWKHLFDNVSNNQNSNITVALSSQSQRESEETEYVPDDKKIPVTDFEHRKLVAALGRELKQIKELEKNAFNSELEFGIKKRKEILLDMLRSVCDTVIPFQVQKNDYSNKSNTAMQDLIDNLVGFEPLPTPEEHASKEEELQKYYDESAEDLDRQLEKTVVYTFNSPEFYDQTMKAERVANEELAKKAVDLEVIDNDDVVEENSINLEEKETADTILSLNAMQEAQLQKQHADEIKSMHEAGRVQAHELVNQYKANMNKGAMETALFIDGQMDREIALNDSVEQAKMLSTLSHYMEDLEKESERDKQIAINGAQETAMNIILDEKRSEDEQIAMKGAQETAMNIILDENRAKDEQIAIKGAPRTAMNIILNEEKQKDQQIAIDGAQKTASNIIESTNSIDNDSEYDIKKAAQETAMNIVLDENRTKDEQIAIKGAPRTAMNILLNEERLKDQQIAIEGAQKTASNIIENSNSKGKDSESDIAAGARKTAMNIILDENRAKDEQIAIKGAPRTAMNIILNEERVKDEQIAIEGAQKTASNIIENTNSQSNNDEYNMAKAAQETAMDIIVNEESQRDKIIAVNGARKTAMNIILDKEREEDNKVVIEGAQETARNIRDAVNKEDTDIIDMNSVDNVVSMENLVSQMAHHNISDDGVIDGAEDQAKELIEKRQSIIGGKDQAFEIYKQEGIQMATIGGEEQAKIFVNKQKSQGSKASALSSMNCEMFDIDNRFCVYSNPSRPIKLRDSQYGSLLSRVNVNSGKKTTNVELLKSLKEDLTTNLDFLRYNEEYNIGKAKAA